MSEEIIKSGFTSTASLVGYSSLTPETDEERYTLLAAVSTAESLDEHIGKVLELRDIVVRSTQYENRETGEMEPVIQTILVAADGKAYSTTSNAVRDFILNIIDVFGEPTWNPGVRVVAEKKLGASGFKYTRLTPAMPK